MSNNIALKSELSATQLQIVASEVESKGKNKIVTYLLWWFTSPLGGHRFYLGDTRYAVLMLLFGWATLFIWPLLDVFAIGKRLEEVNQQVERRAIEEVSHLR